MRASVGGKSLRGHQGLGVEPTLPDRTVARGGQGLLHPRWGMRTGTRDSGGPDIQGGGFLLS